MSITSNLQRRILRLPTISPHALNGWEANLRLILPLKNSPGFSRQAKFISIRADVYVQLAAMKPTLACLSASVVRGMHD
jgi:hypothetical protein